MQFARPEYLILLWGVPALAGFLAWSLWQRRRRLERLVAPALLPAMTEDFSRAKAILRAILLASATATSSRLQPDRGR